MNFLEREEIALRRAQGQSLREIGAAIGRSPSTISVGAAPQYRCQRRLPGDDGTRAGLCTSLAPEAGEAAHQPGTAWDRGDRSRQEVFA
ncbi:helix-turn-helix domain-containing protein [Kocuria sabuli]|uniref:helix-turn-helix domain-containing protein n=1 Tax=Kocuria sabuli TaxID=3071448 RepID=UPI0034D48EED